MNSVSNSGIMDAFVDGFSSMTNKAADIRAKMAEIKNDPSGDQTEKMLELQMMMGQYNSMVELTSNISKSICETMKSLSQKVN